MALMDQVICTLRDDLNCILESLCEEVILPVVKRWATGFVGGSALCQPVLENPGDSATPVKLKKKKKAALDL